ncbi:MAG TPA: RsmE family RNA methyltransferase [Chloroflexia bacterium]|nr:RsmE family RNA methyltransferase [Chloroflexia bacterium]
MNRFFVEAEVLATAPEVTLSGDLAHQLTRVLRLEAGDYILLLDGQGHEYEVELQEFRRLGKTETAQGHIVAERDAVGESRLRITLYMGLLKGEKFDYVLQKGTEVGIAAFVPLLSERCVGQSARPERWRKIIREAAEQSRRGLLPALEETPVRFGAALERLKQTGMYALMAWEDEHARSLKELPSGLTELALLIGPEGGFSAAEAEQARNAGVQTVSLGPRILRAETAGPVAAALALYQAGDMQ